MDKVSSSLTFQTYAQVAQRFGVARPTVYLWAQQGHIPAPSVRVGNTSGFTPEEVDKVREYVESKRVAGRL